MNGLTLCDDYAEPKVADLILLLMLIMPDDSWLEASWQPDNCFRAFWQQHDSKLVEAS